MHEIHAHEIGEQLTPDSSLWGALEYEPRQPRFHAARKALHRLGGIYHHELRAWELPTTDEALTVLSRLYTRTTLALYIADAGETITAAAFERYTERKPR